MTYPSQQELKELLDYDPETGFLTWRKDSASGHKTGGKRAGYPTKRGYRVFSTGQKTYREHRIIWIWVYGYEPKELIDHIDRVPDNNRLKNLRLATPSENVQNRTVKSHGRSGLLGASYEGYNGRWRALISVNGKRRVLGHYDTAEEAHERYLEEKRKVHPTWSGDAK